MHNHAQTLHRSQLWRFALFSCHSFLAHCVCFFFCFFQNHHLTFRFHCCFLSELLADTECWCWCWCCWCECWCGIARSTAGCYFTYVCQFSHFFFWFKLINSLLYVRQVSARHKYTRKEWKRNTILQRVKSHLVFHEISSEFSCSAYLLDKLEWLKSTIQLKMRDSTQKNKWWKNTDLNPDASCKLISTRIPQLELNANTGARERERK